MPKKKKFRIFDGKKYTLSVLKCNKATKGIHKQKLKTMGIRHRIIKENKCFRFYVR